MTADADRCDLLCLDIPKAEAARRRQPPPGALQTWAEGAKALADPTRLAVAIALADCDTACVCDLAWIVGRDEKLVSHHARALRVAGLAMARREGRMVMYALTDHGRALLGAIAPRAEVGA